MYWDNILERCGFPAMRMLILWNSRTRLRGALPRIKKRGMFLLPGAWLWEVRKYSSTITLLRKAGDLLEILRSWLGCRLWRVKFWRFFFDPTDPETKRILAEKILGWNRWTIREVWLQSSFLSFYRVPTIFCDHKIIRLVNTRQMRIVNVEPC